MPVYKSIPSLDHGYFISEEGNPIRLNGINHLVVGGSIIPSSLDDIHKLPVTTRHDGRNAGRQIFSAYRNGKRKQVVVHRAVAEVFMHDFNPSKPVLHYDGDRTNNHISNLYQEK